MEAIRGIKEITNHKITINLPKSFSGKKVEVIILPLKEENKMAICEPAFLSEASLAKDWNKKEEDNAWKNL